MSEKEEADLYSVLGATSCDSVQLLKHKYQQLVLQVNTHTLTCPCGWEGQPLAHGPFVSSTTQTG